MPPPAAAFGSGLSAIIASVVIKRPATEAASSSAVRTTLAGSITPNLYMSPYSSVWALKPKAGSFDSSTLPATTEPSTPAFSAICRSGDWSALRMIAMPAVWSELSPVTPSSFLPARISATPPPTTTPSCTAARVAFSESSTRSLRSFTSISEAPPTRITATPPASFASRSCSFSLS